jgi:hypothetical protein
MSKGKIMETTKRRGFVQRLLCLFGGAVGASAIQPSVTAAPSAPASIPTSGTIRLHLHCRHKHRADQQGGRLVCGGEILDQAGGRIVGQFYANCFGAESTFGTTNPFAASNVEMHTIRLADGMLFGMGASNSKTDHEKAHAIIGGTGRFAGARGAYTIAETGASHRGAKLTINLLS